MPDRVGRRRYHLTDAYPGYGLVCLVAALVLLLTGRSVVLGGLFLAVAAAWFVAWRATRGRRRRSASA